MPVLEEFKKYILRGNVVDLAVGVVIGTAFTKIVDSLVADLFMPVVGVITGGLDISQMRTQLHGEAYLAWGKFLQTVINFIIIGFCMFVVVKGINALHKYVLKEEEKAVTEPTPTEKLLTDYRDSRSVESEIATSTRPRIAVNARDFGSTQRMIARNRTTSSRVMRQNAGNVN